MLLPKCKVYQDNKMKTIVTARISNGMQEGNVFTSVCPSTTWRGYPGALMVNTPRPGMGYSPGQVRTGDNPGYPG